MLNARMARKGGEVDDEERALVAALDAANTDSLRAAVRLALAKFYEHRRKDLSKALEHAVETAPAEGDAAAQRRVSRLERRLDRQR